MEHRVRQLSGAEFGAFRCATPSTTQLALPKPLITRDLLPLCVTVSDGPALRPRDRAQSNTSRSSSIAGAGRSILRCSTIWVTRHGLRAIPYAPSRNHQRMFAASGMVREPPIRSPVRRASAGNAHESALANATVATPFRRSNCTVDQPVDGSRCHIGWSGAGSVDGIVERISGGLLHVTRRSVAAEPAQLTTSTTDL